MAILRNTLVALSILCTTACSSPSIEFTEIPEAAVGGAGKLQRIAGRAKGIENGQRIVIFAKSGMWWVQPFSTRPFTAIKRDSTWESSIHLGTEYAALLVDAKYAPPRTTDVLPAKGSGVIAVITALGRSPTGVPAPPPRKTIRFSGYEWEVVDLPSDSAGVMHANKSSNAWTDARGRLHLRIARQGDQWTCAEIILLRSLGYGTYSFRIAEMPALEPGTVMGMLTWDDPEAGQNHREIDIEISQWGDPATRNAQFTIQPYYVPANVFRFNSPPGRVTHSFRWEPGRVSFKTVRDPSEVVAEHLFTSGIPSPGSERVHINLYIYGKSRTPQQHGAEVVIETFEYLP